MNNWHWALLYMNSVSSKRPKASVFTVDKSDETFLKTSHSTFYPKCWFQEHCHFNCKMLQVSTKIYVNYDIFERNSINLSLLGNLPSEVYFNISDAWGAGVNWEQVSLPDGWAQEVRITENCKIIKQ